MEELFNLAEDGRRRGGGSEGVVMGVD